MRLLDRFYAVTEYRINIYRVSREQNLAVGIEYKFRFQHADKGFDPLH